MSPVRFDLPKGHSHRQPGRCAAARKRAQAAAPLRASVIAIAIATVASVASRVIADAVEAPAGTPWARHQISAPGLDGSDGTRFADVDGDGLLDVATAFEGAGVTLLFRHPGPGAVRAPWPAVAVGQTPSAEDAALVDLDGDGAIDVVTSTEKGSEQLFVHWGPQRAERRWDRQAWTQASIDAVRGVSMWMFTEPLQVRAGGPIVLAAGGKNYQRDGSAVLGLAIPGDDPRDVANYRWRQLASASWVMSIVASDVNGDGHADLIYTDKHGPGCGVWWLENPAGQGGDPLVDAWPRHAILTEGLDGCMLLDLVDVNQDGRRDIVVPVDLPPSAAERRRVALLLRQDDAGLHWEHISLRLPPGTGAGKAATAGDVDGDGRIDVVVSSTGADGADVGVYWLQYQHDLHDATWRAHDIAGPEGIKYDLVHVIDVDADGDLDVLTNDEQEIIPGFPPATDGARPLASGASSPPSPAEEQDGPGLGVVWYENPSISAIADRAPGEGR